MSRIIGDNSHGDRNERNIVDELNNRTYKDLNLNLKEFVKYVCNCKDIDFDNNAKINAKYESNSRLKQDFYLYINHKKIYVSVKMGSGNSVHQEKCEDFISYIKSSFNASEDICNAWRLFLWADGTLDGSGSKEKDSDGNIKSRFSASQFKMLFPEEREMLQQFLNDNQKKLIEHFLFVGRHNSRVDFIYHGTPEHGSWISKDAILDFQINNALCFDENNRSCLTVGKMSIQSWNISRKGNTEHKRGQLQVKYGKMLDDFTSLMLAEKVNTGTFYGDAEEFDLSKLLNKNKSNKIWKKLLPMEDDLSNYYIVKVTSKPKSKLSGRKVFPKTDAYVIKANLNQTYLLEKEYILTEDDLENFDYKVVSNTGISVKLKDSKRYTIQKFTKGSFIKAFSDYLDNPIEIFFALLLYSKDSERFKNIKIGEDLDINYNDFLCKMEKNLMLKSEDRDNKEYYDKIREWAQKIIIKIINDNDKLAKAIFIGEYWFEDPYYAPFIFVHGDLIENEIVEFMITTGSGRSKGKYSIEIKPK